jgi:Insertion element 4 transposase N-terminal
MPRPSAALPASPRLTDHISLGVIARTFPPDRIQSILATTGTASRRQRELPAHVVVYYSIALALSPLLCI